jgi:hypothetical protein
MTELEKYEFVNKCETAEELSEAILKIGGEEDIIKGRTRDFSAKKMAKNVQIFIDTFPENHRILTREYGIRQQAMYIHFYKQ